jgi:histidinol-phosphate aminotransferase
MEGYSFISGTYDVMSQRLGIPAEEIIKLDTNENLYGASPKALEALANLGRDVSIYPDVESRQLRALLEDYLGVGAEHILVGSGEDEIIDLTLRLFLEPDDKILNCPPTFTMYSLVSQWIGGCTVVDVPRRADFSLDVEGIEQTAVETNAKLLYLCSPNNPDGHLLAAETLERLLQLPLVVIVDEAYIEFSEDEGFATWVPQYPNLICMRTFSKWAGLAGLRVGYGIYPLEIIKHLWKIKHPFNVNVAGDVAAQATLADLENMRDRIKKIVQERGRMGEALSEIGFLEPLPSQGNYLLCRVNKISTKDLKQALDQRGILIRNYGKAGLENYVRISVGKPEHTDALLAALHEIGASL